MEDVEKMDETGDKDLDNTYATAADIFIKETRPRNKPDPEVDRQNKNLDDVEREEMEAHARKDKDLQELVARRKEDHKQLQQADKAVKEKLDQEKLLKEQKKK